MAWQELSAGGRERLDCTYRLLDNARFGFAAGDVIPGARLVIDPGLEWSTILGGAQADAPERLVVGASGEVTVVGSAKSPDFPVTPGVFDTTLDVHDIFVSRLSADGTTLEFSTFIGGAVGETALALCLDPDGRVVLGGSSNSPDFPTTPDAFDTTKNGPTVDGVVLRLSSHGDQLLYSTFLGGPSLASEVTGIALGASGEITVAGWTGAVDFPTTPGAFQTVFVPGPNPNQEQGGFVTRFARGDASLAFSTFLSGSDTVIPQDLAVAPDGSVVVVGRTHSVDFPVTQGAFDPAGGVIFDGFISRLSADGSTLLASTFFGGESFTDAVDAVHVMESGDVIVAGTTAAEDFPTTRSVRSDPEWTRPG